MKRKNRKKVSALLLVTGALLLVSGCGKKDPYTVYSEASKKTAELKSMNSKAEIDMDMSAQGQTITLGIDMDLKASAYNTKDMLMDMSMNMDILGQSVEMSSYYQDGYYYMDSMGSKIKYAMDLEEIKEQLSTASIQTDLEKEDFKELTLEEKDGKQVLSYTVKGDMMSDLVDSAMESLEGLVLSGEEIDMNIEDISGTMTINKDGYICESDMKLPLSLSVQGEELGMDMNIKLEYVDPGKEVTVELPDLSEYQEVDMSDLGSAATPAEDGEVSVEDTEDTENSDDTSEISD